MKVFVCWKRTQSTLQIGAIRRIFDATLARKMQDFSQVFVMPQLLFLPKIFPFFGKAFIVASIL